MKILFLSRWFPYPPDNGAKIRTYNLLAALAEAHTVDLISFAAEPVSRAAELALEAICRSVDWFVYKPFEGKRFSALAGFLTPQPRFLVDTYNRELAALARRKCAAEAYDVVIASNLDMTPYIRGIEGPAILFEELEISHIVDKMHNAVSFPASLRHRLTWWKLALYLRGVFGRVDGCTTVSESERQKIITHTGGKMPIKVIPNGVTIVPARMKKNPPEPDTLIYAGALSYQPNFDAVDFFIREIFPLIRARRPGVKLKVTGRLDNVDISRFTSLEGVVLTGFLEDVGAAIAGSWASIVPLRFGGGTRLKILESLSHGTPVISTSKGAEGLDLVPERDILIADNPQQFAEQVLRVLESQDFREQLGCAGKETVEQHYSWRLIGQDFCAYVEDLVMRQKARQISNSKGKMEGQEPA